MTEIDDNHLIDLVKRYGVNGKLVVAICRELGWRNEVGGRAPQWYAAFRGWLGDALERVLRGA